MYTKDKILKGIIFNAIIKVLDKKILNKNNQSNEWCDEIGARVIDKILTLEDKLDINDLAEWRLQFVFYESLIDLLNKWIATGKLTEIIKNVLNK